MIKIIAEKKIIERNIKIEFKNEKYLIVTDEVGNIKSIFIKNHCNQKEVKVYSIKSIFGVSEKTFNDIIKEKLMKKESEEMSECSKTIQNIIDSFNNSKNENLPF